LTTRYFGIYKKLTNHQKMASKKSDLNVVTEINGKPVDASSHIILDIARNINNSEPLLHIEKVFGIVSRETNVLLKFRLIAHEWITDDPEDHQGYRVIVWRLIYLSEDLIDCKVGEWKAKENISPGDEILNHKQVLKNREPKNHFSFEIGICFKTTNKESILTRIARSFNDITTSDFIVKCQDKEFHVHQYVLKQQSEYFNRLLNNNFVESENKSVAIDDFEPEIVEILLRYLYTGAVCLHGKMGIMTNLLKIVDKYNFIEVFDTIDSFYAQKTLWRLNFDTKSNEEKMSIFEEHVTLVEESKLPKLATMLFWWKNSDKSEISDEKWSKLIRENPTFSMLVANTGGRKDYQSWVEQHETWCFNVKDHVKKKDEMDASTLIVGTLGEMKGAVKCSAIL